MLSSRFRLTVPRFLLVGLLLGLLCPAAHAQLGDNLGSGAPLDLSGELDALDSDLPLGQPGAGGGLEEVSFETFLVPPSDDEPALLVVRAQMATGWHVYSITQPDGGPTPTQIVVAENPQVEVGEFSTEDRPKIRDLSEEIPAWEGIPIEEHYGTVTWTAPMKTAEGVELQNVDIQGDLKGQVCHDTQGCIPFSLHDTSFTASLGTDEQIASIRPPAPQNVGEYVTPGGNPTVRGHMEPRIVAPGETAQLKITIEPEPKWHVYLQEDQVNPDAAYRPTIIALTSTSGLKPSRPVADTPLITKDDLQYHEGATTWTIDLPIPADAAPGEYKIEGQLGYQVCAQSCLMPRGVQFRGMLEVGPQISAGSSPLRFDESGYGVAMRALETRVAWSGGESGDKTILESTGSANWAALPLMIGFSLLGGLILNLMPCVLPVIGLKILSFAEQGGQSRGQIFTLNLWYAFGLLSVFIALASLAVFLNLGWGEQFTSTWFNVAMCALVFAMALSFLGVWELPIPGFVGGEAAGKLESQEGIGGAFFKGVLTTVLATPCSGPFLGPVFGFTLKQPWIVTYIIFGSIGLGMALPYLIIGAFPALVKFLPKPGAWMNTFKQLMGFVLLGTVVFLFSFMNKDYLVATFALLVGIWLACWWIGRTPLTANFQQKATAWAGGLATALLVGAFAFNMLVPRETKIPWQPYSPEALAQAQAKGKTVMVDFTADWCLTCKTNLKFAINTDDVHRKVEQNDVVPLLADWTDGSQEIKDQLAELNSKSIPVLAIYPAGRPGEVIVLRDLLTEGQVLEALEKAGPSQTEAAPMTAMKPPT